MYSTANAIVLGLTTICTSTVCFGLGEMEKHKRKWEKMVDLATSRRSRLQVAIKWAAMLRSESTDNSVLKSLSTGVTAVLRTFTFEKLWVRVRQMRAERAWSGHMHPQSCDMTVNLRLLCILDVCGKFRAGKFPIYCSNQQSCQRLMMHFLAEEILSLM